jgi:CBS domain-containing protein
MKDRDIGNVIVMENGRLRGIITDRDLAVGALIDDGERLCKDFSVNSSDVLHKLVKNLKN